MKKTARYYHQDKLMHDFVTSLFTDLLEFKKNGDVKSFNQKLFKVVPKLEKYVQKRLYKALAKSENKIQEYMGEDFVDQLFKQIYTHIEEVEHSEDFNVWLFKRAEALLLEEMIEENFDTNFFDNMDNYSKEEWNEIEEKFSNDGRYENIILEDLDTISFYKQEYLFNNIFCDNEKQYGFEKIDKVKVFSHTEMVLQNLPLAIQNVFELYTEHNFNLSEVAEILNRTVNEVESFLEVSKEILRTSLIHRYRE